LITILCSLIVFVSIDCFAKESNLGYSITKVEGYKVYLKPGTIQIAKNGIFINIAGQLKAVNHLEMDKQGVYFDAPRQPIYGDLCPTCGFPTAWGFCINPTCPSKG